MLALKLISILFFITIAVQIGHSSKSSRVSYGEECNKTARCDNRAWLRCVEGTCVCTKTEEMIYDRNLGKCISKAGERCRYAYGESDIEGGYLMEIFPCVSKSTCSTEGVCDCDDGYYETSEGTCAVAKGHGRACSGKVKCSAVKGLGCYDGICGCEPGKSEYSGRLVQCVGLAGSQCITNQCTPNASCSTNMCICDSGFYWDVTGKCVPKIQVFGNCTADFQCQETTDAKLKCVNGACNCDPKISSFGSVKQSEGCNHRSRPFRGYEGNAQPAQCLPLAGTSCKNRLCAPRSYCEYNYDCSPSRGGTCKCEPGLTQSTNGRCGSDYGGPCENGDECIEGLVCQSRNCSCELDIQLFDNSTKSCRIKVGGPCGNNDDCVSHAECQLSDTGSGSHCKCSSGFVPNKNGTCETAFSGKCRETSDCDSVAGLLCINNVCRCGKFALFHDTERKCVGKVGAPCKTQVTKECIDNAYCKEIHPKLPGSCSCGNGFVEAGNYTCIPVEMSDATVDTIDASNEVELAVSGGEE